MSPFCENCDGFVSARYVRVFAPEGAETVEACPDCPDLIRAGGEIRERKDGAGGLS